MAFTTDYLVIGSGIAGLLISLKAARKGSVTLATKSELSKSSTKRAQGGITAVVSPEDSVEAHIADTLKTGNGLSDPARVELISRRSSRIITELIDLGVAFTTDQGSNAAHRLDLGREGAHSHDRIVHAKDRTGQCIEEALVAAVRKEPNITVLEWHTMVELITDHHRTDPDSCNHCCYGAYLYNRENRSFHRAAAGQTILATGGIGQIYEHTTNPSVATGDGIAAAWRAGCTIANMEFIQFHPTTLYHPEADSFLISEALRGFGAVLRDHTGREFMKEYDQLGSLAPRDVVARAIDREMKLSGEPCVYLDITHKDAEEVQDRFPKIYGKCLKYGIDITEKPVPVVPASHYSCGGIPVDGAGRSELTNLFVCGESACTGVHGANRLASNSLLEGAVFADIIADTLSLPGDNRPISLDTIRPWDDSNTANAEEWVLISHNRAEIRKIMSNYVGIVRTDERLRRALKRMQLLRDEVEHFYRRTKITTSLLELRNMATVGELVIRSALHRRESRGLHFNRDFPASDPAFARDTCLRKSE
ncbi:MAG: L-aspartate oxidase [Fibrobacterota bacterium]